MDFMGYCQSILEIAMDKTLLQLIQSSPATPFAKLNMLNYMEEICKGMLKDKEKILTVNEANEKH
jgi:hypothetical protein